MDITFPIHALANARGAQHVRAVAFKDTGADPGQDVVARAAFQNDRIHPRTVQNLR